MQEIEKAALPPSHLAVIREIHRAGSATRVELAKTIGLTPQSLTRIAQQLIDQGMIIEGERHLGGRGQPAIPLHIAPGRFVSFGIVIEHNQITCTASELGGERLVFLRRRGEFAEAEAAQSVSASMLETAASQAPSNAYALGVGVSISGFFFEEGSRRIISKGDLSGWRSIDLTKTLRPPFPMPVFAENDGRAAAIGQAVDGIGRNLDSFFLLLMTKGIGGGYVHKGELIRGHLGNAGEIGQLLPRYPATFRPNLDSLCEFLRTKWGGLPSETDIDQAVTNREAAIEEWLDQISASLGPALTAVTALLDPKAIILAGQLPLSVRRAIAARVHIKGVNFAGFEAPAPELIVDPDSDCLVSGACALPVADFLYRVNRTSGGPANLLVDANPSTEATMSTDLPRPQS
jgi:predicted NBD/HSP70 family sugar kinase